MIKTGKVERIDGLIAWGQIVDGPTFDIPINYTLGEKSFQIQLNDVVHQIYEDDEPRRMSMLVEQETKGLFLTCELSDEGFEIIQGDILERDNVHKV